MPTKLYIKSWDKYNKLVVLEEVSPYIQKTTWKPLRRFKCEFECWGLIETYMSNITSWRTKSCWCIRNDRIKNLNLTHWMTWTKIYNVFDNILWRCNRINNIRYSRYWGRWIKCEWSSFEEFYKDMWDTYKEWLTIDRRDNDWNYCKKNCRWVTESINSRNRSNTVFYEWIPLWEYCENNNLDYKQTYGKMKRWTFKSMATKYILH